MVLRLRSEIQCLAEFREYIGGEVFRDIPSTLNPGN